MLTINKRSRRDGYLLMVLMDEELEDSSRRTKEEEGRMLVGASGFRVYVWIEISRLWLREERRRSQGCRIIS